MLSADVFEVDKKLLRLAQKGVAIGLHGRDAVARVKEMNNVEQGADRVHLDAADHGSFFRIGLGNHHARDFPSARLEGDGQCASDTAHAAVQRKLTHEKAIRDLLLGESAVGAHDAESHRQVES